MAKVAAVVPAAGSGKRMRSGVKKQFLELAGIPVLGHVLLVLEASPVIDSIVIVTSPGEEEFCRAALVDRPGLKKVAAVVAGGKERQDSVWQGLLALSPETGVVVVHDGARPLLEQRDLEAVVRAAQEYGAAVCAVPVQDTLKKAGADGLVTGTVPRDGLWRAQTPQAFRYDLIVAAHRLARREGWTATDDAALVELSGRPVKIVRGSINNIKITTPEDLVMAEEYLSARRCAPACAGTAFAGGVRTGFGYDVHRLVENRPLILGGVRVPFDKGLLGHSDADVLTHAIMDALLGAAGEGDIGRHFPDHDQQYRGISSLSLLSRVCDLLSSKEMLVAHLDTVVVAQAPRLAPYLAEMKENLAESLGIRADLVNIKATTTEGLGFTGTGEGIAAYATVTVLDKRLT